jgi:hypothetical protein
MLQKKAQNEKRHRWPIFQIQCTEDGVRAAVLAIGQCAALSMIEVVTHQPKIEDEPLSARVQRSLAQWRPDDVEIHRRFPVVGKMGVEHVFDFVSMPTKTSALRTVALKLLAPSAGSLWQAERYGFFVYDITGRAPYRWPRLAVVSKIEEWSPKALELVRTLSTDVILLETDREERIEIILPLKMTELSEAA